MNYIILNGKRSDQIKGLLIQSLPTIMKPLVRTEIEEIEGRDGDIVTKLGYSAYDREMLIGLHGNYDIDEVIEYFDSEGTVIFSNEVDKYYKYEIIEQIDFERLARFRQATVVFHVQPFKFSSVDNIFTKSNNYLNILNGHYRQGTVTMWGRGDILYIRSLGHVTEPLEFYIPIECNCPRKVYGLDNNTYSVRAKANNSSASLVGIRVCNNAPANPATLGYTIMYLSTDKTEQSQTLTEDKTYNYLYVYIAPHSTRFDLDVNIWVNNDDYTSQVLFNRGNAVAKPIYKIYGSGDIELNLNYQTAFQISGLDLQKYIVFDTVEMNAYYEDIYLNRYVLGDFDKLWLRKGKNTLTWTGNISKIEVDEYSRWI